jgi:hypothetical protein
MAISTSLKSVLVIAMLVRIIACTTSGQLEGRYHLVPREQCSLGEIRSDILVLHDSGIFEQHTFLKSGARYDSVSEKWKYVGKKRIHLDAWNDFSSATAAYSHGIKKSIVLNVEPSHPQVIFAPNGCIYTQPK